MVRRASSPRANDVVSLSWSLSWRDKNRLQHAINGNMKHEEPSRRAAEVVDGRDCLLFCNSDHGDGVIDATKKCSLTSG